MSLAVDWACTSSAEELGVEPNAGDPAVFVTNWDIVRSKMRVDPRRRLGGLEYMTLEAMRRARTTTESSRQICDWRKSPQKYEV